MVGSAPPMPQRWSTPGSTTSSRPPDGLQGYLNEYAWRYDRRSVFEPLLLRATAT